MEDHHAERMIELLERIEANTRPTRRVKAKPLDYTRNPSHHAIMVEVEDILKKVGALDHRTLLRFLQDRGMEFVSVNPLNLVHTYLMREIRKPGTNILHKAGKFSIKQ